MNSPNLHSLTVFWIQISMQYKRFPFIWQRSSDATWAPFIPLNIPKTTQKTCHFERTQTHRPKQMLIHWFIHSWRARAKVRERKREGERLSKRANNKVGIKRGIVYRYTYRQFSWLFGVAHTRKRKKKYSTVTAAASSSSSSSKNSVRKRVKAKQTKKTKQTNENALNRDKKGRTKYNRRSKNTHKLICASNKNNKTSEKSSELQRWQHHLNEFLLYWAEQSRKKTHSQWEPQIARKKNL